jgi:hypothetical protein
MVLEIQVLAGDGHKNAEELSWFIGPLLDNFIFNGNTDRDNNTKPGQHRFH